MSINRAQSIAQLRRHYLFGSLTDEQFARVAATLSLDNLAMRSVLFQRGDAATRFFIVVEGEIRLFLQSPAGDERVVDVIGAGKSCAEAVMFMEIPVYPVSADACEPSVVAGIGSAAYLAVLRESSSACLRLLAELSRRVHGLVSEIEMLTLQSARTRFVRHVAELAGSVHAVGPVTLRLEEPKNVLAARLAIKPETLSRILRSLADERLIEVAGREIRIHDLPRLRSSI